MRNLVPLGHDWHMPRPMIAIGLAVISAVFMSSVAAAARPSREFLPPPDGLLDTSCGYEILVTFPVQNEYITTFVNQVGDVTKIIITGNLVVTFTNTATGESLTANISGPSHINFVRGTSSSEGRTGGPVGSLPGLNVFAGRIDNVSGSMHGHLQTSVCEVLAP